MTLQVQEITNFKSGIDVSLDPILSPSDAFVNLENGFVHRGILQSRTGYRHFADGNTPSTRQVSRLANEVTNETADTGDGGSDYTFTLANTQIERSVITVNAPTEGLTVTFTYDGTDQTTAVTGDSGGGTNNINYQTGAMNVSFNANIGAGNDINVTYQYHPDFAVMGMHEFVRTSAVRELIVCDEDFPYFYDATNNDFDRIIFAGATAPTSFTGQQDNFFSFQNWRLNSKGAVPAAAGSLQLDDVLFLTNNTDEPMVYDGTDIKRLSEIEDSLGRNPYREPAEGSLDQALHVRAYGERLCWFRPTLGGIEFPQAVLWGPINDTGGLALDYQGSGSGILSAVTDSPMTSIKFLRDTLIAYFETDVYALELTDDPFQPFRWTKLEDERGSEATHGAVGYLGVVETPGRLGILETNGRRVRRSDDKIPFFTRDRIDSDLLTFIFGEEMPEDSQFWWSYPDSESVDLTTSNRVLVKNYEEENFAIYDIPISVLNKTILGLGIVWDNLQEVFGNPDPDDGDVGDFEGPVAEVIWDKWGYGGKEYRTLIGDHQGFIWVVGDSFSDGNSVISPNLSGGTAINQANGATIQTEYHNFRVNDIVEFRNVNGMTEINGLIATVTGVTDQSTFTVDRDTRNFTAWTSGGEVIKPIRFNAEFVPFNPLRDQGKKCQIVRMDFLVKSGTGEYLIDFFENRNNSPWTTPSNQIDQDENDGTTYKFTSTDSPKTDQWFSIVVDENADFHRWRIVQNKSNNQVSVKSIRIYFKDGGDSNV